MILYKNMTGNTQDFRSTINAKKYFDARSQKKSNLGNIRNVRWVGKNSDEEKETIDWISWYVGRYIRCKFTRKYVSQ